MNTLNQFNNTDLVNLNTAGRSITISTSKIKKMIVIKKNRRENGKRKLELLSNPHSKGEDFSRLNLTFFLRIRESPRTTNIISMTKGTKIINWKIIFSISGLFDWKSNILIILRRYLITSSINRNK